MPKTLQEITAHAEELTRAFEDFEPDSSQRRPVEPLRHLRAAVQDRARAEQSVAAAVVEMRAADYTWPMIGTTLGTSAEAARQRYGSLPVAAAAEPEPTPKSSGDIARARAAREAAARKKNKKATTGRLHRKASIAAKTIKRTSH